ncbi:hypothetical protein [Actinoplanes sp. GCM10030250]|uniref:hypothetical protein n=1 Tax=Actinoplanes sp. GCM10030250 TaxID=3273376 RepID=UPI00360C6B37
MRRILAAAVLFSAALPAAVTIASPAQAATKHSILAGMTATQTDGTRCGDNATIQSTVKLRKRHIAVALMVDVYIGKRYVTTRTNDVDIDGRTKVSFTTCVPFKYLFDADGNYYPTKLRVATMPRSRDVMTVTIKQFMC